MSFRERVARFMAGRYGVDQLNRALLVLYLVLAVIAIFFKPIYLLALVVMVWMFFRVFSKNIYKRQQENLKYMKVMGKFTAWFALQKNKFRDRKTHRYRKCPHCRATLRLPNKKGRHTVRCPKCRKEFSVKI